MTSKRTQRTICSCGQGGRGGGAAGRAVRKASGTQPYVLGGGSMVYSDSQELRRSHPRSRLAPGKHEHRPEHQPPLVRRRLFHGGHELGLVRNHLQKRRQPRCGFTARACLTNKALRNRPPSSASVSWRKKEEDGGVASGQSACLLEGERDGLCVRVRVPPVRPPGQDVHAKGDVAVLPVQSDRGVPADTQRIIRTDTGARVSGYISS